MYEAVVMCEALRIAQLHLEDGQHVGEGRSAPPPVAPTFELRVAVTSATVVASPEWRFGDLARAWVRGPASLVQEVFVELQLGQQKFRSESCPLHPEGASLVFNFKEDEEVMRVAYRNEAELQVRLYAKRDLQSVLRGSPLIGEGRLTLSRDRRPHECEVLLERRGAAGTLCLSCRFTLSGPLKELLDKIHDTGKEEEERRSAAETLFQHLDQDKNGVLEGEEYQDVMEALTAYVGAKYDETWGRHGVSFCKGDVRTSVQWDLDVDFDGTVTKEEFMANLIGILEQHSS